MKFLIFYDLHVDPSAIKHLIDRAKQDDIDFIVCGGDLTDFGRGLNSILKKFNAIGKKFYVIPGNHESEESMQKATSKFENCIHFHKRALEIGDYVFLGYGEDGFSKQDPEFRKMARKWYGKYNGKKIILVLHGPPHDTELDFLEDHGHVGNKDYTKFIQRINPKLVFCGHLHENANKTQEINGIKIINPGWDGMVIDLP